MSRTSEIESEKTTSQANQLGPWKLGGLAGGHIAVASLPRRCSWMSIDFLTGTHKARIDLIVAES